jgi:peptidoglycan/LPS O-acetylase OafA/YrhL
MTYAAPSQGSERRYDLDALRVFAFGLLILYHVGMFYVP